MRPFVDPTAEREASRLRLSFLDANVSVFQLNNSSAILKQIRPLGGPKVPCRPYICSPGEPSKSEHAPQHILPKPPNNSP